MNSLGLILWLQQATLKINMHAEQENSVLQILWGLSVTISCFSVWPSHRSTRRTWCVRCCRTLSMCFVPSAEHPTILADLCPLGQPLSCITHYPWLTLTRLFSMWLLFLPNLPRLSSASAALRLGHLKATCSAVDPRMYQLHVSMKGFSLLLNHARLHCTISAFTQSPGLTLVLRDLFIHPVFAMLCSISTQDSLHLQEIT